MLTISGLKKFYFVPDINDMRCGAHRLLQIVKNKHRLQTDNGDVFIFMSKNQRTVKMVNFEENAYYVHQKTFANGYTFMKLKFVEEKPVYSIYRMETEPVSAEDPYVSMEKDQLISMIHFLVKREEERAQENQELKDMVRDLRDTHKQDVKTQTNLMKSIDKLTNQVADLTTQSNKVRFGSTSQKGTKKKTAPVQDREKDKDDECSTSTT